VSFRTKKRRRIKKEKSDSEVNDSDVMIVESDKDAAKAVKKFIK